MKVSVPLAATYLDAGHIAYQMVVPELQSCFHPISFFPCIIFRLFIGMYVKILSQNLMSLSLRLYTTTFRSIIKLAR
jgi:hypothetical protein